MKKIYSFLDYRDFIEAWYSHQKSLNRKYTYQKLAEDSGFKTNSYLIDVIKRRKDLSLKSLTQVANAMKLGKREKQYFVILVNFNTTAKAKEKEKYFEKLRIFARRPEFHHDALDRYDYFANWYLEVIRELITIPGFKGSAEQIGKLLKPSVSSAKVRKAISLLLKLKLIQKKAGKYNKLTDDKLAGNDGITLLGNLKYHQNALKQATRTVNLVSTQEKEISTFAAAVSTQALEQIRIKSEAFQSSIKKILESDSQADRVYHINFQLIPATRSPKKKRKSV